MAEEPREVWITGVGLASSLGDGPQEHWQALTQFGGQPRLERDSYRPYSVHPMCDLDFTRQIAKKSDLRQMETWQKIGVYAAGLALENAGIAHDEALLARTHLVVAAGSGERDVGVDGQILQAIASRSDTALLAKEILPTALRPTLFLAQLSNLLAGNISIVHHVVASSRTFMGEEMAGLSAVENAVRRVASGQADIILVGGALNAEREDLLLGYELGCNLWAHPFRSVWQRQDAGGGLIPGSAGAFHVIESRSHAETRGAKAYARIRGAATGRAHRETPGEIRESLTALFDTVADDLASGPLAVLSGASGAKPATAEELEFLDSLDGRYFSPIVRAYGSRLGHTVEAHFPLGIALAALALSQGHFFPPQEDGSAVEAHDADGLPIERVLVTGVGHWRGEGLAIVEQIPDGRTLQ